MKKVAESDESKGLDLIHTEVVELFKVKSTDEIEEKARKKMMKILTNLNKDTILLKYHVSNEMVLLHHVSKVGGDLLNKDEERFCLFS